jgi:hypothetical protein
MESLYWVRVFTASFVGKIPEKGKAGPCGPAVKIEFTLL